jgi:hypothetical protein
MSSLSYIAPRLVGNKNSRAREFLIGHHRRRSKTRKSHHLVNGIILSIVWIRPREKSPHKINLFFFFFFLNSRSIPGIADDNNVPRWLFSSDKKFAWPSSLFEQKDMKPSKFHRIQFLWIYVKFIFRSSLVCKTRASALPVCCTSNFPSLS